MNHSDNSVGIHSTNKWFDPSNNNSSSRKYGTAYDTENYIGCYYSLKCNLLSGLPPPARFIPRPLAPLNRVTSKT